MSLFPLAALVKEPRFIPPHRLAVRYRYKWLRYRRICGMERRGGDRREYRCHRRRYREKENVCGPRRRKEAPRKIAREIPRQSNFFFTFLSLSVLFPPLCSLLSSNTRVFALYALNDGPFPLFPLLRPPALASRWPG